MKHRRSAGTVLLGLLLAFVPLAAASAPASHPAEPPVAAPEVHEAILKDVDPGKYGGSASAALAAYWTPEKTRQAEANSAQGAEGPGTKKPVAKIKTPTSEPGRRQAAVDPVSDSQLPASEALKIGEVIFQTEAGEGGACTGFLVPGGNTAGIVQTAAHCVLDINGRPHVNIQFKVGATTFAVGQFVNGQFSEDDLFGNNFERDFAYLKLRPQIDGGTARPFGSFNVLFLTPVFGSGVLTDVTFAGYAADNLLRVCDKKVLAHTSGAGLAYWESVLDISRCQTDHGLSGGPLLYWLPDPCSDDIKFFALGNVSGVAEGTTAAQGAWNYTVMSAYYNFLLNSPAGVASAPGPELAGGETSLSAQAKTAAANEAGCDGPTAGPGAVGPETSSANRAAPTAGLPDWSKAGYREGEPLPGDSDFTDNETCKITPAELASKYRVVPNDGNDDTTGLQQAIDDVKAGCTPQAGYHRLSLIDLPAGQFDVSRQMYVDANFLVLRGQGSGDGGTKFVFRPDENTRYDTVTNGRWYQEGMVAGSGSDVGTGGWIWPGRGMFRVQTRDIAVRYQDDWAAAPANRKDLFEGSVNQHWASGIKLTAAPADPGYSAREGDKLVRLDPKADMKKFTLGNYLWVGAANSANFYSQQGVGDEDASLRENLHMRQEMFRIAAIDATAKTVTLDRPLEYDLPVDSTSDGSQPLFGTIYPSKVTPLKVVEGVGFEDFSFTQDMTNMPKLGGGTYNLTPEQAVHNYGNMAPEYAMHGIVFKWAANDWMRGVKATMTGSHPVVTEDALNVQIERNSFDGAWNKGKGGNGYLRGSRVWNSLYSYNLSRNLRHFTFQWSASGNVAFRNNLDSDLNLHGGWERYNLFEQNTVSVPYDHRSASCAANCGGEGGEIDEGTWFPIWWAAGPKAVKWSGSSGPQNVFYNNSLIKQTTPGGAFTHYTPYGFTPGTAYQFGSNIFDPSRFQPLGQGGQPIPDWTSRETLDYTNANGVATRSFGDQPSLFLAH